jgi:DNA-binding phage protein
MKKGNGEKIPSDIREMLYGTPRTERTSGKVKAAAAALDADPSFLAEFLKARFVEDVLRAMERAGLNKNTLATKLGKSRQYVGRILNEKANFTLETMADIACALGLRLSVRTHAPQRNSKQGIRSFLPSQSQRPVRNHRTLAR